MCDAGGFHTFSMFVLCLCMCEAKWLGTLKSNDVTGTINIPKKLCDACVKLLFNLWKKFFFCVFFNVLDVVMSLDHKVPIDMVDVNCQNWPITGCTRSWYTGMMYWKQCLQTPLTRLSASSPAVFIQRFSMCFLHYLGAWNSALSYPFFKKRCILHQYLNNS